jgi:hypothetical protein
LATLPELDHVDLITTRYPHAQALAQREILRVAGAGGRGDWLPDRRGEFASMDPWTRRAFLHASTAMPSEETRFWLDTVRHRMTALEKFVALAALPGENLKLGEISVASG